MDFRKTYQEKDKTLLFVVDENTGKIDKTKFATKKDIHKNHLWHNETALFIINEKGEILLQKRSQNVHYNKGKFGMVAEHPTTNQTNIESLRQKAKEEIGLDIPEDAIMFLTLAKRSDEMKNKFAYFYYVKMPIKDSDIHLEPYLATEYKWWNYDDLKEKMLTSSPDTVFKNIPFYVYVFKTLEKIVKSTSTTNVVKSKEFLISETKDGVNFPCVLYSPKTKTQNIAILVHGAGSNFMRANFLKDVVSKLAYNNIALMTTNNRGAEQEVILYKQEGDKRIRFRSGDKYENFDDCLFDIESYINLASESGFKNIVLVGHSQGSSKVLFYAIKNHIKNIILLSPVDTIVNFKNRDGIDYKKIIKKAEQYVKQNKNDEMLTDEFSAQKIYSTYREGSNCDLLAFEESRKNRVLDYTGRVAIIKGTADSKYPKDTQYIDSLISHQLSKAKLKIDNIQNADHNYKGHEKQLAATLCDDLIEIFKAPK